MFGSISILYDDADLRSLASESFSSYIGEQQPCWYWRKYQGLSRIVLDVHPLVSMVMKQSSLQVEYIGLSGTTPSSKLGRRGLISAVFEMDCVVALPNPKLGWIPWPACGWKSTSVPIDWGLFYHPRSRLFRLCLTAKLEGHAQLLYSDSDLQSLSSLWPLGKTCTFVHYSAQLYTIVHSLPLSLSLHRYDINDILETTYYWWHNILTYTNIIH